MLTPLRLLDAGLVVMLSQVAAPSSDPGSILAAYGIPGLVILAELAIIRVLWAALNKEREEKTVMMEKMLPVLTDAIRILHDAQQVIVDEPRRAVPRKRAPS